MRGGQLDHFARAHKQHPGISQVFKQLACQAHGGGRHADAVGADLGSGAHFLGNRKAALEQLVERGAQRTRMLGCAHCVLHLSQNLRLAQHHRVQPAGNAESMAGDRAVFQRVRMRAQHFAADTAAVRQPVQRVVHRGMVASAVNLGAVAGGNDGGFDTPVRIVLAQRLAQAVQRRRDLIERERETTAQIERRGVVIDA